MTVKEAATKWGCTAKRVYYMCEMDIIPAEKVTRKTKGRTYTVWEIPNDTVPPKPRVGQKRWQIQSEPNQTPDVRNRQYIVNHQDRESMRKIAGKLGLSVEEVRRIYDEEFDKWR